MVQRVEVQLIDDLDGADIAAGTGETVRFALDGANYEIDLSAKNAAALRKALAVYVDAARRLSNSPGRRAKQIQFGAEHRAIRTWARSNGFQVSDSGRIPAHVRTAFLASH